MAYTAADLRMADDHIAQGEQHIIRQEQLISRMRSQGFPTTVAEQLLDEFHHTLRQHREHRVLMLDSLYPGGA